METLIAVVITTSLGDIHLELDSQNAPITVQNFVCSLKRIITTIQFFIVSSTILWFKVVSLTADMKTKPSFTAPIQNEANNGLTNNREPLLWAELMIHILLHHNFYQS